MKKTTYKILLILTFLISFNVNAQTFNMIHINPSSATFVFDYGLKSSYANEGTYVGNYGILIPYNEKFNYFSLGVTSGTMTFEVSNFKNPYNESSYMFSGKHRLFDLNGFQTDFGLGLVTNYNKNIANDGFFINETTMMTFITDIRYEAPYFKFQRFSIVPHLKMLNLKSFLFNIEFNYTMY